MIQALEPKQFKELLDKGYTVVDTRKTEIFAEGFVEQSISIPFTENFTEAIIELTEDEQKLILVTDKEQLTAVLDALKYSATRIVEGYLNGGFEEWQKAELPVNMIMTIDAEELALDYKFDEFYLIDVRDKADYDLEHVEEAENIALADLESFLVELDDDVSYYVYGATAADAITAGSIFKRSGYQRVRVAAIDYDAVKNSGVDIEKKKKPRPSRDND